MTLRSVSIAAITLLAFTAAPAAAQEFASSPQEFAQAERADGGRRKAAGEKNCDHKRVGGKAKGEKGQGKKAKGEKGQGAKRKQRKETDEVTKGEGRRGKKRGRRRAKRRQGGTPPTEGPNDN